MMETIKTKAGRRLRYIKNAGARETVRRVLLGSTGKTGLLFKALLYGLLILLSFTFLYPILYMLVNSFKSLSDLLNDSVKWIPTSFCLDNYTEALKVMKFSKTIVQTLELSFIPALCQVVVAALTGYAFARYRFPGRKLLLALLVLTFVLPKQATMLPTYLMFKDMDLIGTLWAFVFPSALGQGFNSAIIVLVFYQFYNQLPVSLVEAAQLDGCGHFKVFFYIALPTVGAAFLIGFLFSLVWYWNETYFTNIYIANTGIGNKHTMSTLLVELTQFEASYKLLYEGQETVNYVNEAIRMAGTMVCIAPLLLIYFLLQRYFVQSVDMVGIKD